MGDGAGAPRIGARHVRARYTLGDFRLQLDAQLMNEMQVRLALAEEGAGRRLLLAPDWRLFDQSVLDRLLRESPPAPRPPLVTPGPGPETPRAADLSDLGRAVWSVPAVQGAVGRVTDDLASTLRSGWDASTRAERALMVTHAVVMGGATLATLYSRPEGRSLLERVPGIDIDVPGVEGMSFQLSPRGGGVTLPVRGVPGVSVGGSAEAGEGWRGVDWQVQLQVDGMRLLPWLSRKLRD